MASLFDGPERAHARHTDPQTSHRAAAAVTPGLPELQAVVERYALGQAQGFLDVKLCEALPDLGPSTLRTRRAELTARNIILDSGRRLTPDGATTPHTVWIHRSFVAAPPAIREAETSASIADLKARGRVAAAELDKGADQMQREGRGVWAGQLREFAQLMRDLSR